MSASIDGPRIAIVDEDPAVAHSIVVLLDSDGLDARAYGSVEDFLASCAQRTYSCLLSDGRLSGWGLIELCQRVSIEAGPLPIIVMTDTPRRLASARFSEDLQVAFVSKPFDPDWMLSEIHRLCT